MKFCILYNIDYHESVHGSPRNYYDAILRQVDLLEELGYDSVWFSEHHYDGYSFGNPAVMAAVAAQRTSRIRIGTGVSLAPLNHPIRLAEEYGMLDVLSGGRLEYGVGRGFMSYAYDLFGVNQDESAARMREAIQFVDTAWRADGRFDFEGQFVNVRDYGFFPKPIQSPPPIYAAAARTMESYVWAGEQGYHLCTSFFSPERENTREGIRRYREAAAAAGHDVARLDVAGVVQMYCAPTKAEAIENGGRFAKNYYRFFGNIDKRGSRPMVGDRFENIDAVTLDRNNQVLLGDPEDLIRRITDIGDYFGSNILQMEVAQGGADPEEAMRALRLFGEEVIPAFRQTAPVSETVT